MPDGCGALAQGLVTVVALSVVLAFVDWAAHPGDGPLQRAGSPAELVAAGPAATTTAFTVSSARGPGTASAAPERYLPWTHLVEPGVSTTLSAFRYEGARLVHVCTGVVSPPHT